MHQFKNLRQTNQCPIIVTVKIVPNKYHQTTKLKSDLILSKETKPEHKSDIHLMIIQEINHFLRISEHKAK